MNIDRLRSNTSILIKIVREEFNLSYKQIAMIFNVKPEAVVEWEFDKSKPDEDIVSAMIIAYKWVKFWNPIKLFVRLMIPVLSRTPKTISRGLRKILNKSDQISLEI